jgi:tetratricopeptide (TPR) repeat protein
MSEQQLSYRQVLAVQADNTIAQHMLGVVAYQRGQYSAAVELLERAVEQDPNNSQKLTHLGAAQQSLGRSQEAATSFSRAIAANPRYTDAHNNLGVALNALGRGDEAELSYRQALSIKPDYADAHNNLGILLREQRRLDEAEHCYREALRINPNYHEAHVNLGRLLVQRDRADEAAASYQRALQIRPQYSDAHNNLGLLYKRQHELDRAIDCFQKAIQFSSRNCDARINLVSCLMDQHRVSEAQAQCREAQRLDPRDASWELRRLEMCPLVFAGTAAIQQYRQSLMEQLTRTAWADLELDVGRQLLPGIQPPFNLQFHGQCDRELKEAYASLFRRWIAAGSPPRNTGRPRVGFVVTQQHERAFLTAMGGLLERLDSDCTGSRHRLLLCRYEQSSAGTG